MAQLKQNREKFLQEEFLKKQRIDKAKEMQEALLKKQTGETIQKPVNQKPVIQKNGDNLRAWGTAFETSLISSGSFVYATIVAIYILYILVVLGLSAIAPELLLGLDSILRVFICIFLLVRFNPFRGEVVYTKTDRLVVFNATLFLISSQGLTNSAQYILRNLKYFYNKLNSTF